MSATVETPLWSTRLVTKRVGRLQAAYELLWESHSHAQTLRCDPWDFAVEIEQLHQAGLSNSDLRGLIAEGHVVHGVEMTRPRELRRSFRLIPNLQLEEHTCFVLTPRGIEKACELLDCPTPCGLTHDNGTSTIAATEELVPEWNRHTGHLSFSGVLIKRFRQPAPYQRLILDAFEVQNWPIDVEDPLPKTQGVTSKKRLDYSIQGLNRGHRLAILRFGGDGTGHGVRWRLLQSMQHREPLMDVASPRIETSH